MKALSGHPLILLVGYWGWRRVLALATLHLIVVLSALLVIWQAQEARNLYGELHDLQRQYDELLERRAQLLVERSMHADLTRVERVARDQLDMQFPTIVGNASGGVWLSVGLPE